MKKVILFAIVAAVTGVSCQNKASVNDINPLPEHIYFDVIAVDNNQAETITQGPVVTVRIQP